MDPNEARRAIGLPDGRWADVGGGPVHYREWPGHGPTFVLVHGLGGSSVNWALVAPRLAGRGRVIAPDLVGFGLTPAAGRDPGLTSNWRVLDGFVRALAEPPVVLVGNSMGGMLSLIQCAHAPETVERMILVDAAFPRPAPLAPPSSARVAAAMTAFSTDRLGRRLMMMRGRRLGPEGVVRETLALCAADPASIDPALVVLMVDGVRRRQDDVEAAAAFIRAARSIVRAQVRPAKYRELVRRADRPALVIHGGRDRLVPLASAIRAAERHPDWQLEVYPDLGHIPMMEAPARWLASVERWLDGIASGAPVPPSADSVGA